MITILRIDADHAEALKLANDPFYNTGRLVPLYDGKNWSYRIERFAAEDVTEDCFPYENYEYETMGEGFHGVAAYVDGEPAGFAVCYTDFTAYLMLDNLLVSGRYRRMGVGTELIAGCMELAHELGRMGVKLVCQDNNLQAAEFYLKNGFELGGADSRTYEGTNQEGKTDLFFYKK